MGYRSATRAAASFLLLVLWVCSVHARTWTDRTGRTVEAKFVRVNGSVGVFQLRSGKIFQVPLARLSDDDREYLRQLLAEHGVRVWTDVQGNQTQAIFARIVDGEVHLKTDAETSPVPFKRLSAADRRHVRQIAEQQGQADELPEMTPAERLPEAREWTDIRGNSVAAQLDRVLLDGRVMLATEDITRVVKMHELTEEDHDYLRRTLAGTSLAALVPDKPPPPPAEEIASVDASAPPPAALPVAPPVTAPPPEVRRPRTAPAKSTALRSSTHSSMPRTSQRADRHASSQVFKCDKCGRLATGVKEGDPCPHCNPGGISPYRMGAIAGTIVRYAGLLGLAAFFAGWLWRKFSG